MFFSCFSRQPSNDSLKRDLCEAIVNANIQKVRATLALNAPVDFYVTPELRKGALFENWGTIPLVHFVVMLANGITENSTDTLWQIIDAGGSLDEIYETQEYETSGSILHNALNEHNYEPTFSFLIEMGADQHAINSKGHSVVHALLITTPRLKNYSHPKDKTLAQQEKLEILKLLISKNVKLDKDDVTLMLRLMTLTGKITTLDLEILDLCIDKQIDISPSPDTTILHFLASNSIDEDAPIEPLLQKIIHAGIPVDKQDEQGRTALYTALTTGSCLFSYLVPFANINIADNSGITPLHLAANAGETQTALLLDKEAEITALDNNNRTVMHYAADQFVFDLLRKKGAKIDDPDRYGVTPLMCAAELGKLDFLQKLLRAGANLEAKDRLGQSIIYYASKNQLTISVVQAEIGLRLLSRNGNNNPVTTLTMT